MANSRKRKSDSDYSSIIKKVAVEEASDSSDILSFLAKYGSLIDSIKANQDEALASAMMMFSSTTESPQPQQDTAPIVLEIVQQQENNEFQVQNQQQQGQGSENINDRRQIRTKKPTIIKNKSTKPQQAQQQHQQFVCDAAEEINAHILEHVNVNGLDESTMNGNEMFLLPVDGDSSSSRGENQIFSIHSDTGIIEFHDEEQNQVILPPEFQQPILQLLSTRGQNLKEITFSHNGVLQTIEIVPPDGQFNINQLTENGQ